MYDFFFFKIQDMGMMIDDVNYGKTEVKKKLISKFSFARSEINSSRSTYSSIFSIRMKKIEE
jgi:hypothetical protein